MPTAVISDIHGNAEALRTVLADIDGRGLDRIICLGDIVGYGPQPLECVDLVAERKRLEEQFLRSQRMENIGLLAFSFDSFKGAAAKERPKRTALTLRSGDRAFAQGMEFGAGLAASANIARMMSATPPNVATPGWMAAQAKRIAKDAGGSLRVTVIAGDALERERMEGLINVGKASENEPCLIRIEYTPAPGGAAKKTSKKAGSARPAKDRPAVLIGKTMTYDTGGLSIKVGGGMRGMKGDKDGGCAVMGAMHAIATVVKPKRRVVALLAAAENSISDEAYRPDDIITFRNGVTCEVTNTDAEGRLVLADALCWAKDKENPEFIVDIATLTGGVVTALGSTFAGMWCDDEGLRTRVERSSAACGERVWRLPLHQEYRDMMRSTIADILNSNPNRKAHPIQGAAFLSYFVGEGIPWCHLGFPAAKSILPIRAGTLCQVRRIVETTAIPCAVITVARSGADYWPEGVCPHDSLDHSPPARVPHSQRVAAL